MMIIVRRRMRACWLLPLVAAGAVVLLAAGVPALAAGTPAVAAPAAGPPAGYVPVSASWPTSRSGVVAFGKGIAGAGAPWLFQTADGGRTWRRVLMPSDLPDATVAVRGSTIVAVSVRPAARLDQSRRYRVAVTRDGGRHWSVLGLPGVLPPPRGEILDLGNLTLAGGYMYLTITKTNYHTGASSTAVYGSRLPAAALHLVPGISISGGQTYGSISARGRLVQADLGANYAVQRYWYSLGGGRFWAAPLPCPAARQALTAITESGRPMALCAGSPSDIAPGINDKQVWVTGHVGGAFHAVSPVFTSANELRFAAASVSRLALASPFALTVSFDEGRMWRTAIAAPAGGSWPYLAFPGALTGFVLYDTVNTAGKLIVSLDRTTDGGHTWRLVPLP